MKGSIVLTINLHPMSLRLMSAPACSNSFEISARFWRAALSSGVREYWSVLPTTARPPPCASILRTAYPQQMEMPYGTVDRCEQMHTTSHNLTSMSLALIASKTLAPLVAPALVALLAG